MFTWGTYKIVMAPVLHLDKNPRENKSGFWVMMQSENELDEDVKETKCLCPVVIKGLMSVVKEETIIPEVVLEVQGYFKELIVDEIPNDLAQM